MKHFEVRTLFFPAFFKKALEVGMDLHILIQSTFIVSFSGNETMRFQKMQTSKIPSEIGPKWKGQRVILEPLDRLKEKLLYNYIKCSMQNFIRAYF